MTLEQIVFIAIAGFLGGAINAAAGGGTLVTFPVLLAAGVPPIAANISSSVGLLVGYLGSSLAYRRELAQQRERLLTFSFVSIVGGALGAVLLLVTPAATFSALVPYLVLASAALLAVQPLVSRWLRAHTESHSESIQARPRWVREAPVQVGMFIAAIYGSYFGAGLGVLMLAVLGIFLADNLQRLNGLKSLLSLLVNAVGVVVFIVSGIVNWLVIAVLAPAAFLGGTVGGSIARRLPVPLLRGLIVAFALIVGIRLFFV